jgi:hypothetical protein
VVQLLARLALRVLDVKVVVVVHQTALVQGALVVLVEPLVLVAVVVELLVAQVTLALAVLVVLATL